MNPSSVLPKCLWTQRESDDTAINWICYGVVDFIWNLLQDVEAATPLMQQFACVTMDAQGLIILLGGGGGGLFWDSKHPFREHALPYLPYSSQWNAISYT